METSDEVDVEDTDADSKAAGGIIISTGEEEVKGSGIVKQSSDCGWVEECKKVQELPFVHFPCRWYLQIALTFSLFLFPVCIVLSDECGSDWTKSMVAAL